MKYKVVEKVYHREIITVHDLNLRAREGTMPVVAYKAEKGAICRLLSVNGGWRFVTVTFTQDTGNSQQGGWSCTPKTTPGEALKSQFNHRRDKEIYAFDTEREFIDWVYDEIRRVGRCA